MTCQGTCSLVVNDMSVTIELDLPEALVKEAKASGLLESRRLGKCTMKNSAESAPERIWAECRTSYTPSLASQCHLKRFKPRLTLKSFQGIPIIDAAEALKRLGLP